MYTYLAISVKFKIKSCLVENHWHWNRDRRVPSTHDKSELFSSRPMPKVIILHYNIIAYRTIEYTIGRVQRTQYYYTCTPAITSAPRGYWFGLIFYAILYYAIRLYVITIIWLWIINRSATAELQCTYNMFVCARVCVCTVCKQYMTHRIFILL